MSSSPNESRLRELWAPVHDLGVLEQILHWDQQTMMPAAGAGARGAASATVAALRHEKLCDSELRDVVLRCAEEAEPGSELAAQAREARRAIERTAGVPRELAVEIAEAATAGFGAWKDARAASDFARFRPALERLFTLRKREAESVANGRAPYDVLIEDFDPGLSEAAIAPLFEELRGALAPLVAAVRESGVEVDDAPVRGSFPVDAQLAFARRCVEAIGFDLGAGRLDPAAHPFCSGFAASDVRLTWRAHEDDLRSCLFGLLHEAGHGLYEQGLPPRLARTPAGGAVSMAVHESQSRLWENLVGRSRAFWEWALPLYREHFPGRADVDVERMHAALHVVRPSLIRVEADETTYGLHVVARFEVERRLFRGELAVADLPEAWDDAYEDMLGIRPPDAADGVLQDVHWSAGLFGYFPSYALGNLINAQLFEAARADVGDLDESFRRGEFAPLLGWLREKVHRHASLVPAAELIERASGAPLSAEPFLAHVRRSAAEVYGLSV